ncbi:MAG: FkbM family methyltransferase [Rhodothermales bacterium]
MTYKALLRRARRWVRSLFGRDVSHRPELRLATHEYGSDYGKWVLYTDRISRESIIYSFGVGRDVSFDTALIAAHGVTIHAFDPTPRSARWVADQNLPASFHFHQIGIADYNGTAKFNAPLNPDFVSYTTTEEGDAARAIEARVRHLARIMQELGHEHVDVLKLDVEGSEFEVIPDILSSELDVRQILVEFHHRFASIEISRTNEIVDLLRSRDYRLYYVSPRGEEYSFIRADQI